MFRSYHLFLLGIWCADHVINWVKQIEDSLIKAPVSDLLFGSLGLIFGLMLAYLIVNVIPLKDIPYQLISTVIPIVLAAFLGYLGFRVGFKKKDEMLTLFASRKKKVLLRKSVRKKTKS